MPNQTSAQLDRAYRQTLDRLRTTIALELERRFGEEIEPGAIGPSFERFAREAAQLIANGQEAAQVLAGGYLTLFVRSQANIIYDRTIAYEILKRLQLQHPGTPPSVARGYHSTVNLKPLVKTVFRF